MIIISTYSYHTVYCILLGIRRRPTLWEIKQHQAGWEDVKSASLLSALEIAQSQLIPMVELDKLKVSVTNDT